MNHGPPAALTAALLVRKGAASPMGGKTEPDVVANQALARQYERSLASAEIAKRTRIEADRVDFAIDPDYSSEQAQTAIDLLALWDTTTPLPVGDNGACGISDAGQAEDLEATEPGKNGPAEAALDMSDTPRHSLPVVFRPPRMPVVLPLVAAAAAAETQSVDPAAGQELPPRLWFRSIAAALLLLVAGGFAGFLTMRMIADSRGIQISAAAPSAQPTTNVQSSAPAKRRAAGQPTTDAATPAPSGLTQLTAIVQAAADKVAGAGKASARAPLLSTAALIVSADDGPSAGNDTIASPKGAASVPAPVRRRGNNAAAAVPPPMPLRRPDVPATRAALPDAVGGRYRMQIGTVNSVADVEPEMARLRSNFPDLLGDAEIFVETRAGRYRLVTGRFADARSAEATCNQLKANRQNCLVVRR